MGRDRPLLLAYTCYMLLCVGTLPPMDEYGDDKAFTEDLNYFHKVTLMNMYVTEEFVVLVRRPHDLEAHGHLQ